MTVAHKRENAVVVVLLAHGVALRENILHNPNNTHSPIKKKIRLPALADDKNSPRDGKMYREGLWVGADCERWTG